MENRYKKRFLEEMSKRFELHGEVNKIEK